MGGGGGGGGGVLVVAWPFEMRAIMRYYTD